MFDDFISYYHENAVESYLSYRAMSSDGKAGRSRDLRAALVAVSALFHLREHLPIDCALTRTEAERPCPEYAILGDIANASKHKEINSPTPHGPPLIQHASGIREQITVVQYEDDEGIYSYSFKDVIATLTDGSERRFIEILTAVLNFWEVHLQASGHLPAARTFTCESSIRHRTRQECEGSKLSFEIVRGQRFHQTMKLLKFNNATGKAELIDLTGSKAVMRIYKPSYTVDITLTHQATGRELSMSVELTEEESEILSGIEGEEERQTRLRTFASVRSALASAVTDERAGGP